MNDLTNILIIDDNQENLKVASNFLMEEGFKIALALNSESGLKILKKNRIDLILLDIMMPDISGIELCKKIKKNKKLRDIPVIFLSAKSRIEDLEEGFNAGAVDYITKPFKREILLLRVKSHLELYRSKKIILEMNHTRDKLFSIIAHDIRAPFTNILQTIDYLSSIKNNTNNNEFNTLFNHLKESTQQTNLLLNNLLEWTKFNSGALSMNPDYYNIHDLLVECIQLLNGISISKKIKIELNVPEKTEAYIDEISIHAVFRNILSNALNFSKENGKIIIDSKTLNNYVSISFKDFGNGISKEKINSFYNDPDSGIGNAKERNSGLGLFIIKDFIEQNEGKIEIESTEGKGTLFTVFLPVRTENS